MNAEQQDEERRHERAAADACQADDPPDKQAGERIEDLNWN